MSVRRASSEYEDMIRQRRGGLPPDLGDETHPFTVSSQELHSRFEIGRRGPVKIGYVLAKPKPSMTDIPPGINAVSILMNPKHSLLDQHAALEAKPDVLLVKCHEFFMKPERAKYLRNIDEFIQADKHGYRSVRLLSYRIQRQLADRFSMSTLLEDACSTANQAQVGKYAVPFARNMVAGMPPSAEEASEFPYPLVVKPRDSSKHDTMCVVFDEVALRHAVAWLECDYRLEQFVNHGGWVHKIYAVGRELRIGRRPSLSDMNVQNQADLRRVADSLECDAVLLPEASTKVQKTTGQAQDESASHEPSEVSPVGGYLVFDSAKLTKGRSTGIPVCISLDESELDLEKVRLIAKVFRGVLQCGLFGFDILHNAATDTYYVVDVNIFPGYKGFEGFPQIYHAHLRKQAVVKAVTKDSEKLLLHDLIKRICAAAVPSWSADQRLAKDPVAGLTVTHIKSHNNNIFRVAVGTSNCASDCVIYRIGGQRFRRRPWREMELLAWLRRVNLGAEIITPLVPEYFGDAYPLGRIERCLPGQALGRYTIGLENSASAAAHDGNSQLPELQPPFYEAVTAQIGSSLARLHLMADDEEFQTRYLRLHYANWQESILWRRLESWKLLSIVHWEAAAGVLEHHRIWRPVYEDVLQIMSNLPDVISSAVKKLRCAYSLKTVFSHFDLTPNNVLVAPKSSLTAGKIHDFSTLTPADMRVDLVDFEWSGPCAAVYDFAKFYLSTQMSVLTKLKRNLRLGEENSAAPALASAQPSASQHQELLLARMRNSPALTVASKGMKSMISSYAHTLLTNYGIDIGNEEKFLADVQDFIPIAAAVNICSNILHASTDLLLMEGNIPSTTNLYLDEHQFNWLQHAANHCTLFHFNRGDVRPQKESAHP